MLQGVQLQPVVAVPPQAAARRIQASGLPYLAEASKLTLGERDDPDDDEAVALSGACHANGCGLGGRCPAVLILCLHIVGIVLQVVVGVLAIDKDSITTAGAPLLIVDDEVSVRFLMFVFQTAGLAAVHAVLIVVDASYFLGTSWLMSACAMGMGLASVASGAALLALASFALGSTLYLLQLLAVFALALAWASTLAVVFELLAKNVPALRSQIAAAL